MDANGDRASVLVRSRRFWAGVGGVALVALGAALLAHADETDAIVGTITVLGQGSPQSFVTIGKGVDEDMRICFDKATAGSCDNLFAWSHAGQGFAITNDLIYGDGTYSDFKMVSGTLGYGVKDIVKFNSTSYNLEISSPEPAGGVVFKSATGEMAALTDANLSFGHSGTTGITFGAPGNASDFASFNAPMIFPSVDSLVNAGFCLPTAGGSGVLLYADTSCTSTTVLLDLYSDGTNGCVRGYTPGSASVDWSMCRSGANVVDFSGASFAVVNGALSASTTVTAGTGITATTGNIAASAGAITASGNITSSAGNIAASAGTITASGDIKTTAGNFVVDSPGVLKGDRTTHYCGYNGVMSGTPSFCFINAVATTATFALPAVRDGSFVALGNTCNAALTTGSYTIRAELLKNGSVVVACDVTTSGNKRVPWTCEYTRGTHTFAQGDNWTTQMTHVSGTATISQCITGIDHLFNN